ncbi:MAG: formimidoylglutamate deiminase [Sinobacteraceae bacterium]|nr:formimidoylglutamate deiminase [Nevskiaceae bacterium]
MNAMHADVRRFHAPAAWLPEGWARDVLFELDGAGSLVRVTPRAQPDGAERLDGPVIPGMPNVHSHAFQRAMTGLTEKGGPQGDSFWSWRQLMYRFLEGLTPDDVEIIATQLYCEMLCAGYTAVAEFHYLHHDPNGMPYANRAEIGERLIAAAERAGIALTLLPVFYAHGHFGGAPPNPGQRRFINDREGYARIVERLAQRLKDRPTLRLGAAPHSLRAVTPEELRATVECVESIDREAPIHIHAAEQQQEVDDCLVWSGKRPVAWLLDHAPLGSRWTVVHATHMDAAETVRLARSGAVAGICATTEGDLGDGFFNAAPFLRAGGRLGIGGDSHVGVDPFLELRLFEYGQRLKLERRNVLAFAVRESLGARLYRTACAGGAQALGQKIGRLEAGYRADWIVLNTDDPALAEHEGDGLLDAAIFGPARAPVRDVMVAGRWCVRGGRHPLAQESLARYRTVMRRLLG